MTRVTFLRGTQIRPSAIVPRSCVRIVNTCFRGSLRPRGLWAQPGRGDGCSSERLAEGTAGVGRANVPGLRTIGKVQLQQMLEREAKDGVIYYPCHVNVLPADQ